MIRKVSGAKTVIVPITSTGRNYLPYVEYLNNRYIKYIDAVKVASLPHSSVAPCASHDGLFVSLAAQSGNIYFVKDEPLIKYDIDLNEGIRRPVLQKVSLQNSYITCTDESLVGTSILLVFWYDLPEYSARNKTLDTITDAFEVKFDSGFGRTQLPDNRTMVGKRFRKLLVTYPTVTPYRNSGVSQSDAAHLYITLQKGNYRVIDTVPVKLFYQLNKLQDVEFSNIVFDFTYSYITVGGTTNVPGLNGKSLLINATYEK